MKTNKITMAGWISRDLWKDEIAVWFFDNAPYICKDRFIHSRALDKPGGWFEMKNIFDLKPGECKEVEIELNIKELEDGTAK